ncbi:MAG: anthranilate phosphoribosyltransferase [Gemmatimonadota bacterium]
MNSPLNHALEVVAGGRTLAAEEAADAFRVIMRGEATPALIGALLLALRARGETADEVAGAATALREAMVSVRVAEGTPLVDTCGTGGGGVSTFNISTAAALVLAAAGARVPKHGNRSYTSKSGSADVLEALGVDIHAGPDEAARRLDEAGMAFLFAPNFHPAMRHVGPTRKELGVATIMNLLGPLANPAGVRHQVIGVADPIRGPLMAEALLRLGVEHALVVHGEVGMDEISPAGTTAVWEVRGGRVRAWSIDPDSVGLGWDNLAELAGGEPAENAQRIEALLSGADDEAARRAVLLNAGAAIYVAGLAPTYPAAVSRAAEVLASRAALEVLTRLRRPRLP